MTFDGRYVANESAYIEDAFAVLVAHFADRAEFDNFYTALRSSEVKDEFLRVTAFYRYLVREGDWQIRVSGYDTVIDYLTNSYKLVAVFSLIESLTTLEYQDFYEWLCHENPDDVFPITDRTALQNLYLEYKNTFGSIRRCVAFFERLPDQLQGRLCCAVKIGGQPIPNIKKLAEFLYNLRSKFVHEGKLVLNVSEGTVYSFRKKGVTQSTLSMDILFEAFEVGVLRYFSNGA